MPNFISEDQIEQALLQRLQHVCGFDVLECHTADPANLNDGRSTALGPGMVTTDEKDDPGASERVTRLNGPLGTDKRGQASQNRINTHV